MTNLLAAGLLIMSDPQNAPAAAAPNPPVAAAPQGPVAQLLGHVKKFKEIYGTVTWVLLMVVALLTEWVAWLPIWLVVTLAIVSAVAGVALVIVFITSLMQRKEITVYNLAALILAVLCLLACGAIFWKLPPVPEWTVVDLGTAFDEERFDFLDRGLPPELMPYHRMVQQKRQENGYTAPQFYIAYAADQIAPNRMPSGFELSSMCKGYLGSVVRPRRGDQLLPPRWQLPAEPATAVDLDLEMNRGESYLILVLAFPADDDSGIAPTQSFEETVSVH